MSDFRGSFLAPLPLQFLSPNACTYYFFGVTLNLKSDIIYERPPFTAEAINFSAISNLPLIFGKNALIRVYFQNVW